jgi:hypothetical protein
MAVYATGQIAFWARLGGRDAIVRADPAGPGGGAGDDGDGSDGDGTDGGDSDGEGSDGDGSDGSGDPGIGNSDGDGGCLSVANDSPPAWGGPLLLALISISWRKRAQHWRARAGPPASGRNICADDKIAEAEFLDSFHRR